jgi:RNA polymerase sigma-B factor
MKQDGPFRDELFEAHRYLCRRGARKFLRRGLENSDLEQVAAIGLVKACRRYDASMETPFEAFAWLLILGELMHHVRDHEHAVRVPRWIRALERRYAEAVERLTQRLDREPDDVDVSLELQVPLRMVHELRRAQASRARDDAEAVPQEAQRLPDPTDRILADCALSALEPSARAIVLAIYGLGLSRNEVARRAGITAREVTRRHNAAIAQMRVRLHAS